jgi:cytochrome c556
MADNDDSILNKRPNSLDRIGSSKSVSNRYSSDLLLMEQRSRIETLEMQKLRQQMNDMYREREEMVRQVARVRGGAEQPTENLFRSLGFSAPQARAAMGIPAENLTSAVVRQFSQYEKQFGVRSQDLAAQYEHKQQERQAVAARMFEQHTISRVANPRVGMRTASQADESLSAMIESYAASGTPRALAKGVERISRSRETAGMRLAEAARDVQTPEGRAQYVQLEREYQEKLRKEHALEEATRLSEKKRSELETISGRGQRTVESIMERRGELDIRAGVQKGQYGSIKDIQQNLKSAEDAFVAAIGRFNQELSQTQKVSDETAKTLKDANTELEKQRTIASEAGAGGRGGGRRGGFMTMMAGMGDIIGRGVDFASYAGVGLQAEQMSMRTQAAGMMNQKYSDLFAASQGDMAALRRVSQNQFARSAEYGGVYGGRAAGLGAVGAGVDLATGAAAGAATLATGGAPWSISGGLIVGNLISGARGAARVGAGVTRAEAELNAAAQYRQLLDTVNAVPDTTRQALFDYRMQTFRGMTGAGSRMPGLYDAATSRQTVESLSALGVSPAEQAALFSAGVRGIGPSFMRDPNAAAQMVTRAGEVQAAGVMSAQSYMQRVGQMTTLGGGAKDVEEVLASAVARGVDDAKSLEGIMDLAQAISRDSAARGIGSITEVQRGLSFGMERYKDLPIDESLKRGLVGYQQQDVVNRIRAGGSRLGFEAMGFMSTLTSQIPGMTSFEAGRLAGKDPREMEAVYRQYKNQLQLGKQVPDSVVAALGDYAGLFVDPSGRGRGRSGLDVAKTASIAMPLDAMFASGLIPSEEKSKIMDAIKTGDISKLSPKTKNLVGGLISGAAGVSGQAYQVPSTPTPLQPLTGEAGAAQLAAIAQATGQSGQVLQAQKMLGETTPMSLISQVMTNAARTADVEQAGKDAAQAGEKMTIDTSKFDESVVKFSTAVDKLTEAVRPLGMSRSATTGIGGGSEFFERFGGPVSPDYALKNLNRVKPG